MVNTRAQDLAAIFNGSSWESLPDEDLAIEFDDFTRQIPQLEAPSIFNLVVVQFARRMREEFGECVTDDKVKRRLQVLKRRLHGILPTCSHARSSFIAPRVLG